MFYLKVVKQSVMLMLAVLLTNLAYADNSSKGSSSNGSNNSNGQGSSSGEGQGQSNNESGSESNQSSSQSNANSNSNSESENSELSQPKTHYGIGYEFRKNMQAQAKENPIGLDKLLLPQGLDKAKNLELPESTIQGPDSLDGSSIKK